MLFKQFLTLSAGIMIVVMDALPNGPIKDLLKGCQMAIQSHMYRLSELPSTPPNPAMFTPYNGSERHRRLMAVAKDINDTLNTVRGSPETALHKLQRSLSTFGGEIGQFSPADGRFYLQKLCDRCRSFLQEVDNILTNVVIPSLAGTVNVARTFDLSRQLDAAPMSTLQLATETWEIWAGQGKEAVQEIQRISEGIYDLDDSDDGASGNIVVSTEERSLAAKVYQLAKTVKTVVRKIRLRCIQPIFEPIESFAEVCWLDDLLEAGEALFPLLDDLATSVLPAQMPVRICAESVGLVKAAQRVCELGAAQASQLDHQKWFLNCIEQLDTLLVPILESNPSR